jgi:hypothetical protein
MDGLIVISIIILGLAVLVAMHMGLTATVRGRRGEFLVRQALVSKLSRYDYTLIEDVELKFRDGTVQIDHIIVSRFGLFLIECLHTRGRITAEEHAARWTRRWHGTTSRLINPMRKNRIHLKLLSQCLSIDPSFIHPMVVSSGRAVFENGTPRGVVKMGGLLPAIQILNKQLLDSAEIERIYDRIGQLRVPAPEPRIKLPARWRHIVDDLRERWASMRSYFPTGLDTRDPISGLVRSATVFVIAALLFTLVTNEINSDKESEKGLMMASMNDEGSQPSPFADDSARSPDIAPPQLAENTVPTQAERQWNVDQEINRQLTWEASLNCTSDVTDHSCICREPDGRAAQISFDHCTFLADRSESPPD